MEENYARISTSTLVDWVNMSRKSWIQERNNYAHDDFGRNRKNGDYFVSTDHKNQIITTIGKRKNRVSVEIWYVNDIVVYDVD